MEIQFAISECPSPMGLLPVLKLNTKLSKLNIDGYTRCLRARVLSVTPKDWEGHDFHLFLSSFPRMISVGCGPP